MIYKINRDWHSQIFGKCRAGGNRILLDSFVHYWPSISISLPQAGEKLGKGMENDAKLTSRKLLLLNFCQVEIPSTIITYNTSVLCGCQVKLLILIRPFFQLA